MTSGKYKLYIITLGTFIFSLLNSFAQYEPTVMDKLLSDTVLRNKYESISSAFGGYYKVYNEKGVGLIDSLGTEVLSPIYDDLGNVHDKMIIFNIDRKCGYKNLETGKTITVNYKSITEFKDGYAAVSSLEKDGRVYWGAINKKGKVVIPFHYDAVGTGKGFFFEDKACVCAYNENRHFACGFVNQKGKLVIPLIYRSVLANFDQGIALVIGEQNVGGINHEGDTIIPFIYRNAQEFKNGLAPFSIASTDKTGGWGFIDTLNNVIIPFMYQDIGYFNKEIAVVKKVNFWGLIDMQNTPLTEFKYRNELHFENGKAYITTVGEKKLYLLENGTEIIEEP